MCVCVAINRLLFELNFDSTKTMKTQLLQFDSQQLYGEKKKAEREEKKNSNVMNNKINSKHQDEASRAYCGKLFLPPSSYSTVQCHYCPYSNTLSNAAASQELKAHLVKETKSRRSQSRNRCS